MYTYICKYVYIIILYGAVHICVSMHVCMRHTDSHAKYHVMYTRKVICYVRKVIRYVYYLCICKYEWHIHTCTHASIYTAQYDVNMYTH